MSQHCEHCGHESAGGISVGNCPACGLGYGQTAQHGFTVNDQRSPAWRPYLKPLAGLVALLLLLMLLRLAFEHRDRPWEIESPAPNAAVPAAQPRKPAAVDTPASPPVELSQAVARIEYEFGLTQRLQSRWQDQWLGLGGKSEQDLGSIVAEFEEIGRDWHELEFSTPCFQELKPAFKSLAEDAQQQAATQLSRDYDRLLPLVLKNVEGQRHFRQSLESCRLGALAALRGQPSPEPSTAPAPGGLETLAAEQAQMQDFGLRWKAIRQLPRDILTPPDDEKLSARTQALQDLADQLQAARFTVPCFTAIKPLYTVAISQTISGLLAYQVEGPDGEMLLKRADERMDSFTQAVDACGGLGPG